MPVSKISRVGVRSSTSGAGRWIGQRSLVTTGSRSSIVSPGRVDKGPGRSPPPRPPVAAPAARPPVPGPRDRAAGVAHRCAAGDAVGGVHGHRAHAVVAEMLLHLADERVGVALAVLRRHIDLERVVDLGELVVREHGLDDDARDLLHPADATGLALRAAVAGVRGRLLVLRLSAACAGFHALSSPVQRSPSAPATTSMISWVISAWRWRFISRVRSSIRSDAFSDALRMAVIRAPCSDAVDSSRAL